MKKLNVYYYYVEFYITIKSAVIKPDTLLEI